MEAEMQTRMRQRGQATTLKQARMPDELVEFCLAFGRDYTAGLVRCVDLASDLKRVLGESWLDVEVVSRLERLETEGEAMAMLIKEALAARGYGGKKTKR